MKRTARTTIFTLIPPLIALAALGESAVAGQNRRPIEPPLITPAGGEIGKKASVQVSIKGEPGSRIVYTVDGSSPTESYGIRHDSDTVFFTLPPGDVTVQAIAIKTNIGKSATRRVQFTRVDYPDSLEWGNSKRWRP